MSEYGDYYDEKWARKYMNIHWKHEVIQESTNPLDIINSDAFYRINKALRNGGKFVIIEDYFKDCVNLQTGI